MEEKTPRPIFEIWRLPTTWNRETLNFAGDLSRQDTRILQGAMEGRAKSVLVERDYIDKDYRNAYSGFYSKKFARVSNRCLRLHFFDIALEQGHLEADDGLSAALTSIASPENVKGTTPGFLGSVVLRPLSYSRIGRCMFDPRKTGSASKGSTEVCLASFRIHCGCRATFSTRFSSTTITTLRTPGSKQERASPWRMAGKTSIRSSFPFLPRCF